MKALQAVFELLQAHYPERLAALWFLNAPFIFWGVWRLVSPCTETMLSCKVFNIIVLYYRQSTGPQMVLLRHMEDARADEEAWLARQVRPFIRTEETRSKIVFLSGAARQEALQQGIPPQARTPRAAPPALGLWELLPLHYVMRRGTSLLLRDPCTVSARAPFTAEARIADCV